MSVYLITYGLPEILRLWWFIFARVIALADTQMARLQCQHLELYHPLS